VLGGEEADEMVGSEVETARERVGGEGWRVFRLPCLRWAAAMKRWAAVSSLSLCVCVCMRARARLYERMLRYAQSMMVGWVEYPEGGMTGSVGRKERGNRK
jgi:hypothetical protein